MVAAAVLLQAFLKKDFSFAYVAENSDARLSTFYRIAGFWAGQQGSFLLWLLLLAVVVVVIAVVDLNRLERLTGGAVTVLGIISAVFAALMVLDTGSDPFVKAEAGTTPFGLNPLLLHPAMVLHPPALFIGYVGLAVPFAFAVSTLLLGRGDKLWVQRSQKWAVFGWLFLSLGIGLGAWWAYVVLSFGGYWAWDAVENTSLVPWLTATALLHAFTLYKSRGLFKRWALGLAALTFFFTILATWTTRTGLISSVHAFEERACWSGSSRPSSSSRPSPASASSPGAGAGSRATTRSRAGSRGTSSTTSPTCCSRCSPWPWPSPPSRVPLLLDRTVGASTYDAIARPLGVVILALIAICPLLAWRKTEGAQLRKTLILPAVTHAAVGAAVAVPRASRPTSWGFIGLVVCGFAFGAVIQFVLRSARRAAGPDRSLWSGLGRAFTGSRTRTAAYVVHIGMVLVVAGLLGSTVYKVEQSAIVKVKPGADREPRRLHAHVQGHGTRAPAPQRLHAQRGDVRRVPGRQGARHAGAAHRRVPGERRRRARRHPGPPVRGPVRGRRRAVRHARPRRSPCAWSSSRSSAGCGSAPSCSCVGAVVSLWPKGRKQEQEARAARRRAEADGATA